MSDEGDAADERARKSASSEELLSSDQFDDDKRQVVVSMSDLRQILEEAVRKPRASPNSGTLDRPGVWDEDDQPREKARPLAIVPRKQGPRSLSVFAGSSSMGSSPPLVPLYPEDSDFPEDGGAEVEDCDPTTWIIAAGPLDKKRDGGWKSGWCKRFFVLTPSTLYYFLVAKRGGKGDNNLLGEARGQIRLENIQSIGTDSKTTPGTHLICLECVDIKKSHVMHSLLNKTSIVLKANTQELAKMWADRIKNAQNAQKTAAGGPSKGVKPAAMLSSSGENEEMEEPIAVEIGEGIALGSGDARAKMATVVLPIISSSLKIARADSSNARHVHPFFAVACLVGLNACCYAGPPLNLVWVWVLVNLVFLGFVLYYEKLANEQDASVYRHNRTILSLQNKLEQIGMYLENPAEADTSEGAPISALSPASVGGGIALASPTSPRSPRSPKSPKTESLDPASCASPTSTNSIYDENAKPAAGYSTTHAAEEAMVPLSWAPCEHSKFEVRQVGYKQNKLKGASGESMYDMVGLDVIKSDERIEDVYDYVTMPPPRPCDDLELIKRSGLPRIFCINIQIPMKGPMSWEPDPGVSVVYYFAVKPATVQAVLDDAPRPEIKLLHRFMTKWSTDNDVRRRLKGIGIANNFKDLSVPSAMGSLNGKPVILYKTAQLIPSKDGNLQAAVKVHKFGATARLLLSQFQTMASDVEIRAGFLLQGELDEELPECLLGCTGINGVDLLTAKHVLKKE